jgi:radical SAM superfamily enzyme YgiQ (UPF0313 family)
MTMQKSITATHKATKKLVYLADLTHTGQIVSANVHPLGIGLIAAYAKQELGENVEVQLFKYPEDLGRALDERIPDIMGFSNYSWNFNLGYAFAERVKRAAPETAVVFGGPNYGFTDQELSEFWSRRTAIDFHMVGEGERAFVALFNTLSDFDFDVEAIKSAAHPVANGHYRLGDRMIIGEVLPRIRDLTEIPSPYLEGLMDKFFDSVLIPAVHTTRGCPFTCTFCTEGSRYYNKVAKRYNLEDELEYIGSRVRGVPDLIMSDANFGMFKEDADKARAIAALYDKYSWPKHIQVAGGKNQKHRLREVTRILKGRMDISASMQSTDPEILKNIKRANISYGELSELGEWSHEMNAKSFVELILGLPGDTVAKHRKSVEDSVRSGVSVVRMHQLIMLPQTEMMTPESKERYGMETKYRVASRSFGRYRVFGEEFIAAEYDEICTQQDSMSFEEYIDCRMSDLTVEITHNGNVFRELYDLCSAWGLDWAELISTMHANLDSLRPGLKILYESFRRESMAGLWDDVDSLETHVKENLDHYIETSEGVNQQAMTNAKARAFFHHLEDIHESVYASFHTMAESKGVMTSEYADYLSELRRYSLLRKTAILDCDVKIADSFSFDFPNIFADGRFDVPDTYRLDSPRMFHFDHDHEQRQTIRGYVGQYGETLAGLGRVLMKLPIHRVFRSGRMESKDGTIENAIAEEGKFVPSNMVMGF